MSCPCCPGRSGDLVKSVLRLSLEGAMATVNYQVKVTNTGKTSGGVSVLAFVTSDVSATLDILFRVLNCQPHSLVHHLTFAAHI